MAWKKHGLPGPPPNDYEAFAEGFTEFVDSHCGCTFIQSYL